MNAYFDSHLFQREVAASPGILITAGGQVTLSPIQTKSTITATTDLSLKVPSTASAKRTESGVMINPRANVSKALT